MEEFKLSVPKPRQTGLELLNEMFEMAAGNKKSAQVAVLYNYTIYPRLDFWRLGRDGIAIGFLSVPVFDLPAMKILLVGEKLAAPEEKEFFLTREEYGERVPRILNPRMLIGDPNQRIEDGQALGPDKTLVLQWGLRSHPFIDLHFDGFYAMQADALWGYVSSIDRLLTFNLTVRPERAETWKREWAETKYLFTSSLTELVFPLGRAWRARDDSFDLDTIFHSYKTLDCQLEPSGLMRELWAAGRVNNALQKKQDSFDELFAYWRELNKELERLNQEYIRERNGGLYPSF